MIEIIIANDKETRTKMREGLIKRFSGEIIYLDDINSSLVGLEAFVYPSLFSVAPTVVHATYLIEEDSSVLTSELLKKIVSSPTIFILEERSISSPLIKIIEKEGGIVHQNKELKSSTKPSTIFGITNALTAQSKKERWLAYQKAKEEHSPEALIGILYWKLRQLSEKPDKTGTRYKGIYSKLIQAHKESWQKGFPLDLAIERVILEQQ